ncbi:MAG: DUF3617 domain-containing protein [Sphingomonas sp.]|uniref:DUF3617 domain-containing protein n=1 Tax=Sphingomonas adhaesiva TaxID=28212 RepID=A0A2A4I8J1_9SPHN|nr:DUF3617 domain-containing protein [Sphingomonas adhaesiva]PZU82109.1 MAG: DUF3617 domain-containing protein [Sphingomonas sp.]
MAIERPGGCGKSAGGGPDHFAAAYRYAPNQQPSGEIFVKAIITLTATAAVALSLAACDRKTGSTTVTTNAATGEVSATSSGTGAQPVKLEPGKWEIRTQVSDLKMKNMPKGVGANPPPATMSVCITPEQAAKGPEEMLKQAGSDCTVTSSSYTGGKMESELTCKMPGGGTMHARTKGTFSSTAFTTDQQMEITGTTEMSQKVHSEAKRVGACDAAK